MENNKTISNTPMVLGIIGGVLGLPGAICSGVCAASISSLAKDATQADASNAGIGFLWIGIFASVIGLISAFLYKRNPKVCGVMMLIAGLLTGVTLFTFNILSLIVCVLFFIAGILALMQSKQVQQPL